MRYLSIAFIFAFINCMVYAQCEFKDIFFVEHGISKFDAVQQAKDEEIDNFRTDYDRLISLL